MKDGESLSMMLLEVRAGDPFAAELAGLLLGIERAVEEGVGVDPGDDPFPLVGRQSHIVVAAVEQLRQLASPRAPNRSGSVSGS